MIVRLLAILAIASLPAGVWAADELPASAAPAATSAAGSNNLQPVTFPAGGGSSADSTGLQPAGGTGLGSAATDSSSLSAPTGSSLQGSVVPGSQLQSLLASEADGAPQQPDEPPIDSSWPELVALGVLAAATIAAWLVRRRQLARARLRFAEPALDR